MTEGNLAEDEIQKTIKELFCSKKFTGEVHKVLSLLSVLNIFLSITAFLGNTLILVALHEEASLHPLSTSKLLYRNLAISDLCVGVILEPTAITYLLSVINEKWEICYYASVINHVAANLLCALSLYTVTAISVDRLLALSLRLRYRQVTTLKRTCLSVTVIWIMCLFGVILSLHGGYLLAPAGVNSPQFFRTQNYFALCATIKFIFSTTVLLGNPAKQLH